MKGVILSSEAGVRRESRRRWKCETRETEKIRQCAKSHTERVLRSSQLGFIGHMRLLLVLRGLRMVIRILGKGHRLGPSAGVWRWRNGCTRPLCLLRPDVLLRRDMLKRSSSSL